MAQRISCIVSAITGCSFEDNLSAARILTGPGSMEVAPRRDPSLLTSRETPPSANAAMQDAAEERKLAIFGSGSYRAIATEDVSFYYEVIVSRGVALFLLPQIFARFILYVGRRQWAYRTSELRPGVRRALPWAVGVAVLGNGTAFAVERLQQSHVLGFDSYWVHASAPVEEAGVLGLAFCYLAGIVLLFHASSVWRSRLGHLAPVGRMALTNYLTHSVLYLFVFSGVGLGLYGEVGPALCVVIAFAIFGAQMAVSRWWLSRYRFGPAEWVWRTLTYGQLQPMRAPVRAETT